MEMARARDLSADADAKRKISFRLCVAALLLLLLMFCSPPFSKCLHTKLYDGVPPKAWLVMNSLTARVFVFR